MKPVALILFTALLSCCTSSRESQKSRSERAQALGEKARVQGLESASKEISAWNADKLGRRVYFLEFNNEGKLLDQGKYECARAVQDFTKEPPSRIIVLSLGWNNDREKMASSYRDYLNGFIQDMNPSPVEKKELGKAAIFCVVWDSDANLLAPVRDIIPSGSMADWLAKIPNMLLSPFTVWSKSSLADRIGGPTLPNYIKAVCRDSFGDRPCPPIYAIGHSFGCRIIAEFVDRAASYREATKPLMTEAGAKPGSQVAGNPPSKDYRLNIKGAVFVLPAMSPSDLPARTPFPLIVCMSRHDHANSTLMPLANTVLNMRALKGSKQFIETMKSRIGLLGNGSAILDKASALADSGPYEAYRVATSAAYGPLLLIEGQAGELKSKAAHPLRLVPDTLAQLPLIEIPIKEADAGVFKGRKKWGEGKGLLDLGRVHESAARRSGRPGEMLLTPETCGMAGRTEKTTEHFIDFTQDIKDRPASHWLRGKAEGVYWVDCTDEIHGSVLNLVLGYERDENGEWQNSKVARLVGNKNKLMRYTLGKIDPLGSHASYLDPWTTERKKDTVALFRIIQHLFDATD